MRSRHPAALDGWLSQVFSPARLPHTIDALAAAQSPGEAPEVTSLREVITGHDRKLAPYRAALDAGADPAVVSGWITETQAARLAAGTHLRALATDQQGQRMSKEEIAPTVSAITGLMRVLEQADPVDKAEIYTQLGLRLT